MTEPLCEFCACPCPTITTPCICDIAFCIYCVPPCYGVSEAEL
jgi:hypothetical protein